MIITKTTTKKHEVRHIACNFMLYGTYRKAREKYRLSIQKTCFQCNKKFADEDMVHLVFIVKGKNQFFCDACKLQAINEGVSFSERKEGQKNEDHN